MCGLAGFCNFFIDYQKDDRAWRQVLVAMRESIAHRGSDDVGEYLREHVGLSHTRLAIRDLSFGAQPIIRTVEGKEYAIVYNGEIYNAEELQQELKSAGYRFETTTDTEVILYGYMHEGVNFAKKLNGIFAFAIWDSVLEQLVLCRDRAGVKPLFYAWNDDTIVFGSEIKALFCHPDVTPSINLNSFREVFGIGPARTAGQGVFRGVLELQAGHYAVFSRDGMHDVCYWELLSHEHPDSYELTVETVSFLVRDAIIRQMVADVPVCTFLSGGLDSGIVTAVAADYMLQNSAKLNTFSFDFTGNDIYFQSNSFQRERDRPYVDIMLQRCDVTHTYLECDEAELAALLTTAVDAKDLPGMADIDASLLYFCKLVKRHNKVALTGECADEIFGGYPWFYRPDLLMGDGFPWSKDLGARTMLLDDGFVQQLKLPEYIADRYRDSIAAVPRLAGEGPVERRRREIAYLNIKWFMQTLLDRMDRCSMYSGLEARVPFADHRIIEYVFNVPWEMKYRDGVEKALLRDACGDLLPQAVLHRKKSPYPKTYNPNYERLLCEALTRILEDSNAPILPYLNREKVRTFMCTPAEYGRPWFGQLMAGPQMMAYLIQVNDWMKRYHLSL